MLSLKINEQLEKSRSIPVPVELHRLTHCMHAVLYGSYCFIVVALSLLCRCSVIALLLLCRCSVVALLLLLCRCSVVAWLLYYTGILFLRLPTFICDSAILCSGYSMALPCSTTLSTALLASVSVGCHLRVCLVNRPHWKSVLLPQGLLEYSDLIVD